MTDTELRRLTALYRQAYRLYKTAMHKDVRDGYTHGKEVEVAASNWYAWYRLYVARTGTLPPPAPCH